jgi:hypothetical protein
MTASEWNAFCQKWSALCREFREKRRAVSNFRRFQGRSPSMDSFFELQRLREAEGKVKDNMRCVMRAFRASNA